MVLGVLGTKAAVGASTRCCKSWLISTTTNGIHGLRDCFGALSGVSIVTRLRNTPLNDCPVDRQVATFCAVALVGAVAAFLILTGYPLIPILAAVLYEYLATFTTEVEVVWKRNLTNVTSVLFLVNRYNAVLEAVITAASIPITIRDSTVRTV